LCIFSALFISVGIRHLPGLALW